MRLADAAVGASRSFVRCLLGAMLALLGLVVAFNVGVDARSIFGTGQLVGAQSNADRRAKLDRLDAAGTRAGVIVVGSSRAMKVDPEDVEDVTGLPALNLAHSGAMPANSLATVRYVAERYGGALPHVVYALDLESFRVATLDPFLLADRRMRRQLSRGVRARAAVDAAGAQVDLKTTRESWTLLREASTWRDGRLAVQRVQPEARRRTDALYRDDGYYLHDYGFSKGVTLQSRMREHIGRYFDGVLEGPRPLVRLEPEQQATVRELVAFANAHGDAPTIYLTPFQPGAWRRFLPFGVEARRLEIRTFMDGLERDGLDLHYVDALDPADYGSPASAFYDDIHPQEQTNRRLLEWLDAQGALLG